jgi:tRNA (cmo5U34)-methyltransferase
MTSYDPGDYRTAAHAHQYLARANDIPHRTEGEAEMLALLPAGLQRVLDIGTGDGRLLALVKTAYPQVEGVGLDFSQPMLTAAHKRFAGDARIRLVEHNLDEPLPNLGSFDAVVSCFAIHHLSDARKAGVYREAFASLRPGGVFCNLEHVSSPSPELHQDFLRILNRTPPGEDPANQLSPAELQLSWLGEIGYHKVDCFWKWREFALLAGVKPAPA